MGYCAPTQLSDINVLFVLSDNDMGSYRFIQVHLTNDAGLFLPAVNKLHHLRRSCPLFFCIPFTILRCRCAHALSSRCLISPTQGCLHPSPPLCACTPHIVGDNTVPPIYGPGCASIRSALAPSHTGGEFDLAKGRSHTCMFLRPADPLNLDRRCSHRYGRAHDHTTHDMISALSL